ncbi:MAG: hypothetical protein ABIN89_12155 [Chitinophagaceae bacterium]
MNFKNLSILILCLITFNVVKGQERFLTDSNDTKALSQKVTELFKENKISLAMKELKLYWPLPVNELDVLEEKTVKYLNMVEQRFGKAEGTIKINEQKIKDIAIRETYFVLYQNTAIRLIYIYYKNKNGWVIGGFKWDDSFIEEFK